MNINKDTQIYASFSQNPGNSGCKRFNRAFEVNGINAIYKSFRVPNIREAFYCSEFLGFRGFAISMPFKTDAIRHCNSVDNIANRTKSVNTVAINNGKFYGFNTDYNGIFDYFEEIDINGHDHAVVLGTGAFARTAMYVFEEIGIRYYTVVRSDFESHPEDLVDFDNSIIFNGTPMKGLDKYINESCMFIDCDPDSVSGKRMSFLQAKTQFYEIYGFDERMKFEDD